MFVGLMTAEFKATKSQYGKGNNNKEINKKLDLFSMNRKSNFQPIFPISYKWLPLLYNKWLEIEEISSIAMF